MSSGKQSNNTSKPEVTQYAARQQHTCSTSMADDMS